jgi:hypothetical protein
MLQGFRVGSEARVIATGKIPPRCTGVEHDLSGPDGPDRGDNPWHIDSQSDEEHEADVVAALRMVRGDTTAEILVRAFDRLITERDELREKLTALTAPLSNGEVVDYVEAVNRAWAGGANYNDQIRAGLATVFASRAAK